MKIKTNAKINYNLKILGKAENGYHYIESIFLPCPIFDELEIDESENFLFDGILPKTNICIKAKELFYERAKPKKEVAIKLTKNIPLGGGLGGASSNAAGVLLGLNEIFNYPFNNEELLEMAKKLGSDVPFFIYNKPAKVTGFGEKIEILESGSFANLPSFQIPKFKVHIPKNISCDTKKVYAQFDKENIYDFTQRNMLQNAAFSLYPELKREFDSIDANEKFLTGSGSGIVIIERVEK